LIHTQYWFVTTSNQQYRCTANPVTHPYRPEQTPPNVLDCMHRWLHSSLTEAQATSQLVQHSAVPGDLCYGLFGCPSYTSSIRGFAPSVCIALHVKQRSFLPSVTSYRVYSTACAEHRGIRTQVKAGKTRLQGLIFRQDQAVLSISVLRSLSCSSLL
jgi:hypothetical protein